MISINRLIWDNWNTAHIGKHGVMSSEAEEACQSKPVTGKSYQGRIRVIGATKTGRILTVILVPKEFEDYYPVTARPASRKERQLYLSQGGETND